MLYPTFMFFVTTFGAFDIELLGAMNICDVTQAYGWKYLPQIMIMLTKQSTKNCSSAALLISKIILGFKCHTILS